MKFMKKGLEERIEKIQLLITISDLMQLYELYYGENLHNKKILRVEIDRNFNILLGNEMSFNDIFNFLKKLTYKEIKSLLMTNDTRRNPKLEFVLENALTRNWLVAKYPFDYLFSISETKHFNFTKLIDYIIRDNSSTNKLNQLMNKSRLDYTDFNSFLASRIFSESNKESINNLNNVELSEFSKVLIKSVRSEKNVIDSIKQVLYCNEDHKNIDNIIRKIKINEIDEYLKKLIEFEMYLPENYLVEHHKKMTYSSILHLVDKYKLGNEFLKTEFLLMSDSKQLSESLKFICEFCIRGESEKDKLDEMINLVSVYLGDEILVANCKKRYDKLEVEQFIEVEKTKKLGNLRIITDKKE